MESLFTISIVGAGLVFENIWKRVVPTRLGTECRGGNRTSIASRIHAA
jgi:hypothetical protein